MKPFNIMRRFGRAPGWTPVELTPKAKVLLDDESTVIDDGTGVCSSWNDRSGNNYHFSQSTASKRPLIVEGELNGCRILRLDGVNDNLLNTGTGARQIYSSTTAGWCFTVFRRHATTSRTTPLLQSRESTSASGRFSCYAGIASPADRQNKGRILARRLNGDAGKQLGSGVELGTNWTAGMFAVQWSTGTGRININGGPLESGNVTSSGSTSSGSSDTAVYIGSEGQTTFGDVDLACMLLGSGTLPTPEEHDLLFGYYMHRYGIQDFLPADHLYRDAPP